MHFYIYKPTVFLLYLFLDFQINFLRSYTNVWLYTLREYECRCLETSLSEGCPSISQYRTWFSLCLRSRKSKPSWALKLLPKVNTWPLSSHTIVCLPPQATPAISGPWSCPGYTHVFWGDRWVVKSLPPNLKKVNHTYTWSVLMTFIYTQALFFFI